MAVEQQVLASVEEIWSVQGSVSDSMEWAGEDATKDTTDTLGEVVTVQEEGFSVAKTIQMDIALLPEARRNTPTPLRPL